MSKQAMDCVDTEKRRKRNADYDKMDRLSTLADDLLVHILSFISLEEGISTSTLSRRWRFLWTRMTTLDFKRYHKSAFINRVLIFHRGFKIRSFKMDIDYHFSNDDQGSGDSPVHQDIDADSDHPVVDDQFNSWVYFAISRSVEELTLEARQKTYPDYLYTCGTVAYMKLAYGNLNLPDYIDLSSLTSLRLSHIELGDDDVKHLTSGCPLLDWLCLSNCNRGGYLNISITNPTLQKVEVFDTWYDDSGEIEIDAPHLPVLRFGGNLRTITVKNLESLIDLILDLDDHDGLVELVNIIQPVNLDIGRTSCIKGIYEAGKENSLSSLKTTYLHLMVDELETRKAASLIMCFPNLEYLKISLLHGADNYVSPEPYSYDDGTEVLSSKKRWEGFGRQLARSTLPLKSIEIDEIFDISSSIYYDDDEEFCMENFLDVHSEEIELVRTFLNGGKTLKRMTLRTKKGAYHGLERKMFEILYEVAKELLSLPRTSPKLEIKFC